MNGLVQRLSQGDHPVEASLRPDKTAAALKECIDRGYVHIKFINTQGGTDLGVRLDPAASNFNSGDFERQTGKVHLVGNLTLNYSLELCKSELMNSLEAKMNRDDKEDTTIYKVVVNHEEQYSIWPADRENPLGWSDVGKSGLKPECLEYIKQVWTDMRPLSLRKKMEEASQKTTV